MALMDYKLGAEYRDVAMRPEQLLAMDRQPAVVLRLIDEMEAAAEPIEIVWKVRPLSADPADDLVLDLAINGRANVIITGNRRHSATAAERFHISVMTPAEFMRFRRSGGDLE